MGYCIADDAQICDECGVLIADGRRPEHTSFHDVVTTLSLEGLKRLRGSESTPASVHALQERADRERLGFAWLHHCGVLNHGYWSPGSMCTGCRFSVDKAGHVDAHYRLVPVEGLSDEGQA